MYISISNIKKRFGKSEILKDVSLSAGRGECIGILGGNGCGKSTLLSILAGALKADGGSFHLEENDLMKNSRLHSQCVGYVPQGVPLFEELTAQDNLLLWFEKADMKRELESGVLRMLGIGEFLHKGVSKLSGGMKKRLSIGCAMAHKPQILLLDEPTAALDLVCKADITAYLKSLKSSGTTILIATHDLLELEFCDSLYILKSGILVPFHYDGNAERLVKSL